MRVSQLFSILAAALGLAAVVAEEQDCVEWALQCRGPEGFAHYSRPTRLPVAGEMALLASTANEVENSTDIVVKKWASFGAWTFRQRLDAAYAVTPMIEMDAAGAVFVCLVAGSSQEAVVMKFSRTGLRQWTLRQPVPSGTSVQQLHPDAAGGVVLAGLTRGSFDGLSNPDSSRDVFVLRVSSRGDSEWVFQTQTPEHEYFGDMVVSEAGEVVVAGHRVQRQAVAGSSPRPSLGSEPLLDSQQPQAGGRGGARRLRGLETAFEAALGEGVSELFVLKLSDGGVQQFAFQQGAGENGHASVAGVALSSTGEIVVAGQSGTAMRGPSEELESDATSPHASRGGAFVVKLGATGSLQWSHQRASTARDSVRKSIVQSESGDVFILGHTMASGYEDEDSIAPSSFLMKLNSTSGSLQWESHEAVPAGALPHGMRLVGGSLLLSAQTPSSSVLPAAFVSQVSIKGDAEWTTQVPWTAEQQLFDEGPAAGSAAGEFVHLAAYEQGSEWQPFILKVDVGQDCLEPPSKEFDFADRSASVFSSLFMTTLLGLAQYSLFH